jgi:hypothetical protein
MVMNPNPYYPPYQPPQSAAQQKVAIPVWVIALVCAGVVGLLGMITLAFVAHHSPLLHRVGIVHSASYNQGYDTVKNADPSKFGEIQSSGYDARSSCTMMEPFIAVAGQHPANAADWIEGCTDGLRDKGMR